MIAQAAIVIHTTRVIFPAAQHEVSVDISNTGSTPELIRAWIDRGDIHANPGATRVPFFIFPSAVRIIPGKTQKLHINLDDGQQLPDYKESVFWLNILDAAPHPSVELRSTHNLLSVATRSRLKLLYRPAHLTGAPRDAAKAINWTLVRESGRDRLQAVNSSAYAVSFARLEVAGDGTNYAAYANVIKPQTTTEFTLLGHVESDRDLEVHYQAIDDFGGVFEGSATLPVESKPAPANW
ncbi:fimbria/pilus periplasmic chaperone [Burkholderia pyrrocinia]